MQPHAKKKANSEAHEVIVVSDNSDDDGDKPARKPSFQARRADTQADAISISSLTKDRDRADALLEVRRARTEEYKTQMATRKAGAAQIKAGAARYKAQAEQYKADVARLEADAAEQRAENTLERVSGLLMCSECAEPMYRPVSLRCGHSFCERCLRDVFAQILEKYLKDVDENYCILTEEVQELVDRAVSMKHSGRSDEMVYEFEETAVFLVRASEGPRYICPSCKNRVYDAPTRAYVIEQVVEVLESHYDTVVPDDGPVDWTPYFLVFPY
ncbi:hypothetical protein EIP91_011519 [Steccherinum ochraceum]|uniref:RING-type domain-containing protein n=1 Tax=Steccherinum ochraceum TaxID=92696 RepID=A0A4R0R7Y2_9APHY|nr:hypothetical protein EIP91_011519 [Steccherinum ochraceum]